MNVVEEIRNKKIIHWFRNDQRVSDHEVISVHHTLKSIRCFYLTNAKYNDNHQLGFPLIGYKRKQFINESLQELKKDLEKLCIELTIIQTIDELKELEISDDEILTYQKLFGTEELEIERQVLSKTNKNIALDNFTLINTMTLPFELNKTPDVFSSFRKKIEKYGSFQKPINLPNIPTFNVPYKLAGGEQQAIHRLNYYFFDKKLLSTYKETRNGMLGTDFSSRFSPWLSNGNISARTIHYFVKDYENKLGANSSTYWLIFELLWRDFFQFQLRKHGSLFFKKNGINGKTISYRNHEDTFWNWANGNTGDDLVDANMIELKATGWMSNRGRQNVASFLVHDLNINWRWGAAWMESQLIDYEPASNWGNWMYIDGVGNDQRPFRKFNTQGQAERYDPTKSYREKWLK